jgi:hypothetical protein
MAVSNNLRRLIEANAPLWAGEAEIVRTYWTSPVRTREAEILWLRRQCWKEWAGLADSRGKTMGMVSNLEVELHEKVPLLDTTVDRHDLRDTIATVNAEFSHYCWFADIYDTFVGASGKKMNAHELTTWPEEEALASRRREVCRTHGKIGLRSTKFTEGGYCTMFTEGIKLKGRPGIDGRIGTACQHVFDDEYGHMMAGVIGVDEEGLSDKEWRVLEELTVEQLKLRLDMRNAQFSHPVSAARIKEILAGKIEPVQFDYARAESFLAEHAAAAE